MSVKREIQPSYRAVCYVPTAMIRPRPFSVRGEEEENDLLPLAASIRQYGLLQPVTVRVVDSGYEIVLGERRWQACVMLGYAYIDAFVLQISDQEAALYSLLENSLQAPLHFFDLARCYAALDAPPEAIARQMGGSAEDIQRLIGLLRLPLEAQHVIRESHLTERHARALLTVSDEKEQTRIARQAARLRLSPRDTEALARKDASKRKVISTVHEPRLFLNAIQNIIRQMRQIGLDAQAETSEDDDSITRRLRVRKRK